MFSRGHTIGKSTWQSFIESIGWVVNDSSTTTACVLGVVSLSGVVAGTYVFVNSNFFEYHVLGIPRPLPELIEGYLTGFYTHHNIWQSCYLRRDIGQMRHLNMSGQMHYNQDLLEFYNEYLDCVLNFHHTHPVSSELLIMFLPIHW
jgi:hypothetical protein